MLIVRDDGKGMARDVLALFGGNAINHPI